MLIKTRGIIFRSVKYGETSFITDIYTEEKGLRNFIISGVRRPKSTVSAGLLQVMSLVDMVTYYREDKEMNRIKEIKAAHIYTQTPFDMMRSAVGMFMVELARKTIREKEENKALFNFLYGSFKYLDETKDSVANLHLKFMLDLTVFAGFLPNGQYSEQYPYFDLQEGEFTADEPMHFHYLQPESSQLMSQLLFAETTDCHQFTISREQRRSLLRSLIDFYRLHIDNFPKLNTHEILEEVLG
ncbi:MAG: DNA repair protein RecO [Bacteroidota bacterium]